MARSISVDELRRLRDDGVPHALVDVREKGNFVQRHIFKAVPIPRGLIELRFPQRIPWKDVPVIVYDDGDDRAGRAAETISALGYADVRVLDGGLSAWADAGLRTDYGTNVPGKDYGEKVAVVRKTPHLTPDQIVERRQQGDNIIILDSRTREEFERSHVPGAYSVPGGELATRIHSVLDAPENKDATIVVNCAGRTRSILGADVLIRMGIDNPVYALENGTMAWSMAGHELERGDGPELPIPDSEAAREASRQFAARVAGDDGVGSITVDQLRDLQQSSEYHYVVDVRLPAEYESGHIAGSASLPAGQIALAGDELLAVNQAHIVMVSNSDVRSRVGGSLARQIGYPKVSYLVGGLEAWQHTGQALDSGTASETPAVGGTTGASISVAELKSALDAGDAPAIIDVKGSGDYALNHIAGSTWVPRGDLERRIESVVPSNTDAVVITCESGVRSSLAAATLADMGYENVRWLEGGLNAWKGAGNETVEGLDGADVPLKVAKDDIEMIGRVGPLARNRQDMLDYLEWEINLGDRYETEVEEQA